VQCPSFVPKVYDAHIFFDMIEEIMEVFMDDFSIYGKTFNDCLENLDRVL
jgi:hypothetical protein